MKTTKTLTDKGQNFLIKEFKTRDSATSALRRQSIGKGDYNKLIQFDSIRRLHIVHIPTEPEKFEPKKVEPKKFEPKKVEPKKVEPKKVEPKKVEPKKSLSSTICDLIREGKTNAEIWAIVKPEFSLGDNKKYYPAWNRANLIRKGLL